MKSYPFSPISHSGTAGAEVISVALALLVGALLAGITGSARPAAALHSPSFDPTAVHVAGMMPAAAVAIVANQLAAGRGEIRPLGR